MRDEDDLKAWKKIRELLLSSALVLLVAGGLWHWGLPGGMDGPLSGMMSRILDAFGKVPVFSSWTRIRMLSLLLVLLHAIGQRSTLSRQSGLASIILMAAAGLLMYFFGERITRLLALPYPSSVALAIFLETLGLMLIMISAALMKAWLNPEGMPEDLFNEQNEQFLQQQTLIKTPYSVNLKMRFRFNERWFSGWINIINPFRGVMVLGTPGSGKTYSVIESFIRQEIEKDFTLYIYDYKYPDLTRKALTYLKAHESSCQKKATFHTVNFQDARTSERCNPLSREIIRDITDAYQSAYAIMMNLNRTWILKQGDFFVESPIILLTAIIWFLRSYDEGKYCTFPHAIELLCQPYRELFPVLLAQEDLENYLSPFMDAWQSGAQDQLQGQLASAKIPLSRLISPELYWVMSGEDFTLDVNNPDDPKVVCLGSDATRQDIYSAALGLYNASIIRQINRKGQRPCGVIIDELPTVYFKGLDQLIATARSNRVSVLLAAQDLSQIVRDYGERQAAAIYGIVGNVLCGQVMGKTAEDLSRRLGRILQQRNSQSERLGEHTYSESYQMDTLITPSRIASLEQGEFTGQTAAEFGIRDGGSKKRIFCCHIDVPDAPKELEELPQARSFVKGDSPDHMTRVIQENFRNIRAQAREIIQKETDRIRGDVEIKKRIERYRQD